MKLYIIYIIFILSFSKGIFVLLGIPDAIPQLIIEFLILILFIFSVQNIIKTKKITAPGLNILIFLTICILFSFLFTKVSNLQFILFIRNSFIYLFFFYSLFNLKLTEKQKKKVITLLMFLFLIQIPAAFIKLIVLGEPREKIVGTVTVMEGSLSTIMPLFPIVYLISRYLENNKLKDLVLIVLFMGIGLISDRLGILFYVIILFICLSFLYAKPRYYIPNFKFLKITVLNSVYIVLFFIAFLSLNPRGNPEHIVGGSVDVNYLIDFTENYQTLDLQNGVQGDGRFDAPYVAFERLYEGGLKNIIFGFGPGEIIKSSLIEFDNPLLEIYNIGYGGRIGIVWIMMQIGILGLILFLMFHILLFKKIWHNYKNKKTSPSIRIFSLTTMGFSIIYFMDIFTYSSELILSPVVALTYYYGIYYILTSSNQMYIRNCNNYESEQL